MHSDSMINAKADFALLCALSESHKDEHVQVVMLLEHDIESCHAAMAQVDPSTFASRRDYRIALIELRKQKLSESMSATIQALRDLKVRVEGGCVTPTVVVCGPAVKIVQSLHLPGVLHASLDAVIPVSLGSESTSPEAPRRSA